MTLPELHPDELLSREASSTLTPDEWADLRAHLERCPACALERAVRHEAARARVPSNEDHAIAARVVGRLLAGQTQIQGRPPEEERPMIPAKRAAGVTWGRRLAYGALALVLVSGTAVAGVALVAQVRNRAAAADESERGAVPPRAAPRRHRGVTSGVRGAEGANEGANDGANDGANAETEAPPGVAPAAETEPAPLDRAPAPAARVEIPGAPTPVPRPNPARSGNRQRSGAAAAISERPASDAALLLGRAEAAESGGRLAEASRLYRELGRRFSGTREEIVARALHGQLLLDRLINPTRALALFQGYLDAEPAGALAEEARLGRARALERLGRSGDERTAWVELLRAHPRSVHAPAARARLAALDHP